MDTYNFRANLPDTRSTKPEISLWSGIDPRAVEILTVCIYGKDATTAAARCALDARTDGRSADYRYWLKIFRNLKGGQIDDSEN